MTTKHTPGPWTVSDNHGKRYIEPVGDNEPVAMICRGHADSYSANAHLIAAAPELLEALEIMIVGACAVGVPHAGERKVLQDAVDHARATINKARGAQ